jgi:serine/threonine protein kinase
VAKLGPGARVGDQFHLIRKIGEGGCGEVYLAEQTTLGRNTVVKLMHPELSRDPSYVARFQREARLAARLIHHHTAAIYAFGETPDKVLWIAMEYIEGESLHNVLARESPRQLAELLAPVADVLDRAGGMGIIHRDVKPDNILVAPDGDGRRAVLLDFGLARPKEDNDKLTAVGVAVGSPTYMSPEQVFGPSVDSATDRYALGIILYIAVAKRPPFRHDDRVQLVLMHKRNQVPLLNSIVPGIPPNHPLDQFFSRALAKQPGERFPSARQYIEEFAMALDAAPLPIFGDAPTSGNRSPLIKQGDRASLNPTSPAPPQSAAATSGSRRGAPPPLSRGAATKPEALPQVPQSLRTTMPAFNEVPPRSEAPLRPEPLNPRSIEAWGARAKPTAPPIETRPATPTPMPPPAEASSSALGTRRLMAYLGGSSEALDILATQTVTMGKHRDCDIVCRAFPSPEQDQITHGVSRQHARLTVLSGKLLVEDMRSLNGTFVDDRRLALGSQVPLTDGQLIRLGPVLTLEVRMFKSGGALLRRVDEFSGGFPATLVIWKEVAIGDPVISLVPASNDSPTRWGSVRSHGENQELWWYGPQAVLWQRGNRQLNGAQALVAGDRMTLGTTVIEWDAGQKPGLV